MHVLCVCGKGDVLCVATDGSVPPISTSYLSKQTTHALIGFMVATLPSPCHNE